MATLPTRYGVLSVPDEADDVIVGFLRRYGEWAWDETCFVADNLPDGARVADIGAFLGTFGLGLARMRRLGSICFVEPNPAIAQLLRDNVERNCEAASTVVEAAVAPIGWKLNEGVYDCGNLGSLSYAVRPPSPDSRRLGPPVQTIELGALRRRFGEFDLIKIDAEGLETDILRDELPSLTNAKTILWIEANEDPRTIELGTMLIDAGMQVFYFAWDSFNPENFGGDEAPTFPFAYEAGLYATMDAPPVLSDAVLSHQPIFKQIKRREDLVQALWATPRWGLADWVGRALPEVVALAGRELRGDVLAGFPAQPAEHDRSASPLVGLRQRLARTEEGLAQAESLALRRLAELERIDQQLGATASVALERLALIGLERERVLERNARISELEQQLRKAETELAMTQHELGAARDLIRYREAELHDRREQVVALTGTVWAIESSSIWRATGVARRFVTRHPALKAALRAVFRAAYLATRLHRNGR